MNIVQEFKDAGLLDDNKLHTLAIENEIVFYKFSTIPIVKLSFCLSDDETVVHWCEKDIFTTFKDNMAYARSVLEEHSVRQKLLKLRNERLKLRKKVNYILDRYRGNND